MKPSDIDVAEHHETVVEAVDAAFHRLAWFQTRIFTADGRIADPRAAADAIGVAARWLDRAAHMMARSGTT